jgi:hypothetical protein
MRLESSVYARTDGLRDLCSVAVGIVCGILQQRSCAFGHSSTSFRVLKASSRKQVEPRTGRSPSCQDRDSQVRDLGIAWKW